LGCGDATRYCVRVEGRVAEDEVAADDYESEADAVDAMEELLTEQVAFEAMLDESQDVPLSGATRDLDLCRECYGRLLHDPMSAEPRRLPRFSTN
jgi:hypothetical protein